MFGVVADREQAAMDLRVQRLHPAVHHFGKAGELGDVVDRQAGRRDRLRGAAGGDELDAVAGQRVGELDQAGLVGNGQQGAGNAAGGRSWARSLVRGTSAQARGNDSRASRWCSIQSRQSRESGWLAGFGGLQNRGRSPLVRLYPVENLREYRTHLHRPGIQRSQAVATAFALIVGMRLTSSVRSACHVS